MRPSALPAWALVLWLGAALVWWGFAFLPMPSVPPEWLSAARAACFGSLEGGLPAPYGWALLVLGPGSFLVGILALWGAELRASARSMARSPLGATLFALIAAIAVAEGAWVAAKVRVGLAVAAWDRTADDAAELPAAYPRGAGAAPDFSLIDQHGRRVALGGFRGRPVLVAFVFAHCQTMCPLIVQNAVHAVPSTAPFEVLMVTLDPWRDTPSALPSIARRWSLPDNFHVLSSSRVAEVLGVAEAYRVPFERSETSGDIAHPGLVFLVDAEGRLAYTFNNPPPAWIREGLDRLAASRAHAG
jgi:protein SCO1/2